MTHQLPICGLIPMASKLQRLLPAASTTHKLLDCPGSSSSWHRGCHYEKLASYTVPHCKGPMIHVKYDDKWWNSPTNVCVYIYNIYNYIYIIINIIINIIIYNVQSLFQSIHCIPSWGQGFSFQQSLTVMTRTLIGWLNDKDIHHLKLRATHMFV